MRSSLWLRRIARTGISLRPTTTTKAKNYGTTTPLFLTTTSPSNSWIAPPISNNERFQNMGVRPFSTSPEVEVEEVEEAEKEDDEPHILPRFEDFELHPKSLKALRRHGLHQVTEIQEKTYDVIVSGKDVVGRARTGTGKTLGFLLPALERIVRRQEKSGPAKGIQMLILSPTRELAAQIAKEAEWLVAQHDKNITSQVIYGGSSKREDIGRFEQHLPTILVATPGRLKDHMASTSLRGKEQFIETLQNLQTLVMDETDRLLDLGFRRDIQDILSCLPKKRRQTLLFSATLPKNVLEVVNLAIKKDYQLIDCIQDEDPTTHTNTSTEQSHVLLPADRFWTGSMEVLLELIDKGNSKVMVFFPMTSMVQLYSRIFNMRFGRRVWELHGRMHQRERTTISGRFRNASKGILFTSDVSARGVDYPNVTHVIQIGASESRETYIHRLGRTGRAGKRGKGMLILPEVEEDFLQDLHGLEISRDEDLQSRLSDWPSKKLRNELGPLAQSVRAGRDDRLEQYIYDAYQAMVAYYFQRSHDSRSDQVVATVNALVQDLGMIELPAIDAHRARRIGLDTVSGLNIKRSWKDQDWTDGWGDSAPPTSSSSQKPFGMPYGDFDGKFGNNDQSESRPKRRNSWDGPDLDRNGRGGRQGNTNDRSPRSSGGNNGNGRGGRQSNRNDRSPRSSGGDNGNGRGGQGFGNKGRSRSFEGNGGNGCAGRPSFRSSEGNGGNGEGRSGRAGFRSFEGNGGGGRPDNRSKRSSRPSDGNNGRPRSRGDWKTDPFSSLGWKKGAGSPGKSNQFESKKERRTSFQRWDVPGEFSTKS